jgi:hypothetical protein
MMTWCAIDSCATLFTFICQWGLDDGPTHKVVEILEETSNNSTTTTASIEDQLKRIEDSLKTSAEMFSGLLLAKAFSEVSSLPSPPWEVRSNHNTGRVGSTQEQHLASEEVDDLESESSLPPPPAKRIC